MSIDDPRGHDDGDIATGSVGEREQALDGMFHAFLLSIADEGMYGADDLADACNRAEHTLRHGKLRGQGREVPERRR